MSANFKSYPSSWLSPFLVVLSRWSWSTSIRTLSTFNLPLYRRPYYLYIRRKYLCRWECMTKFSMRIDHQTRVLNRLILEWISVDSGFASKSSPPKMVFFRVYMWVENSFPFWSEGGRGMHQIWRWSSTWTVEVLLPCTSMCSAEEKPHTYTVQSENPQTKNWSLKWFRSRMSSRFSPS